MIDTHVLEDQAVEHHGEQVGVMPGAGEEKGRTKKART